MQPSRILLITCGLAVAGAGTWLFVAKPWKPRAAQPVWVPAAPDRADTETARPATSARTAEVLDEFRAPTLVLSGRTEGLGVRIHPIGWSAESRFAYRRISEGGGCGVGSDEVLVQDVMTDRIISRTAFCERPCEPCEENLAGHDGNFSWRRHQADITRVMERHGISPLKDLPLIERAEVRGEDGTLIRLRLEVNTLRAADPENEEWDPQVQYRLLATTGGATKAIHTGRCSGKVQLVGYVRNPFREEVVVLVEEIGRGFEGVEEVNRKLVGCQLADKYFQ
jgi:hypothetical protein